MQRRSDHRLRSNGIGGFLKPPGVPDEPIPTLAESLWREIIAASPAGITVLSEDGIALFANERAAEMTGFASAEAMLGHHLREVLAPSDLALVETIRAARHRGDSVPRIYETTLTHPTGELPVEVRAVPTRLNGASVDIVFLHDISERHRFTAELSRPRSVLQTVTQAVEDLVAAPLWEDAAGAALGAIATAVGIDSTIVWRVDRQADGEILPVAVASWMSPERSEQGPFYDREPEPLIAGGFHIWVEILRRGGHVAASLSDYPPRLRERLGVLGPRAIALAPIFVGEEWYGVVEFADCLNERSWGPIEVHSLRLIASTLGAIIRKRRAEDAFRGSEERLRIAVEQAADGILLVDRAGAILDANRRASEILRCTQEELTRSNLYEITAPEERTSIDKDFAALDRGEALHVERKILRGDGSVAFVEISKTRLSDGRFQGIMRDVTERVRAQEEVDRRDRILEAVGFTADLALAGEVWEDGIGTILERLGRTMGASSVGLNEIQDPGGRNERTVQRFRWVDPDGGLPQDSPGLRAIPLNQPGAAMIAEALRRNESFQSSIDRWPGPTRKILDASGIRSLLLVPIFNGERWWGVLGITDHRSGRTWSPLEVAAVRSAAGILGGIVRRRLVEVDLRKSEDRYRGLVEGFNDAIVQVDRQGVLRFANRSAAVRLGIEPDEASRHFVTDFFPRAAPGALISALGQAIDARKAASLEQSEEARAGTHWSEIHIQPLIDTSGQCESALVMLRDITDRREAEEEILRYQNRLRSLASELTLAEQRERRRIASELHDRIGQSLVLSKLLLSGLRSTSAPEQCSKLDEVLSLVDQTLQDARSLTFDISPPILYDLGLLPAIEWLAERFQGKYGVQVVVEAEGQWVPLQLDLRVIVFRAVQELLLNVVKHSRSTRAVIRTLSYEGGCSISVEDNGIGFDPEGLGSPEHESAGFGLFNIRERLELFGCRLTIASRPGGGTTATITVAHGPDAPSGKEALR